MRSTTTRPRPRPHPHVGTRYIENLFRIIRPQKIFYMAVDGCAYVSSLGFSRHTVGFLCSLLRSVTAHVPRAALFSVPAVAVF